MTTGSLNQLSYIKPPTPPIKMNVEEYIELLNKISNSKPGNSKEATLKLLENK